MKKWAILILALCLIGLTACGDGGGESSLVSKPDSSGSSMPAGDTAGRRLGLSNVSSMMMDGTDKTRLKVTAVALLLDKDNTILDCDLDEVDFTVALTDGKATLTGPTATKGELGDDYTPTKEDTGRDDGLKDSWEDQAEAFCDFAEGKMVSEITGLAATDGKSEKIEGCDLIITDFIRAVERAADAAVSHDMGADDDLHLALLTAAADTATDEKPQYDIEMAAVTLDEGDKITGCMTDSVQMKLSIEEGAFTMASGEVLSKRRAGDSYGMKPASAIKREWYEQADAFDLYVRGKTADQLGKITLDSEGKTDAISGCTITVSGMMKCVKKAAD